MARQNMKQHQRKPDERDLLTLEVLRREQVSPHFVRVTLGGGDVEGFTPMGFDQWFRLFIPVADGSTLDQVPRKLTSLSYLRFLAISKATRPVLRNYTVRAHRDNGPDGPELDVDFVLHTAPDGSRGFASDWAATCTPGDPVAIIDEGIGFTPPPGLDHVVLVADESGLPAVEGILASVGSAVTGRAVVEVPSHDDTRDLARPDGVEVEFVVRDNHAAVPGGAALAHVHDQPVPDEPFYGWVVGESALAVGVRRHWIDLGVPKDHVMFCGYWKADEPSGS